MSYPSRTHGRFAVRHCATALCAAIVLALTFATGAGEASSGRPITESGYSVAYKLATIDCKCVPSRAQVKPYAQMLNILAKKKCRESKAKIGDMAVLSTQLLRKQGIRMSILTVLRGVNRSIPASLGRTRCVDIFAAFVILVEQG